MTIWVDNAQNVRQADASDPIRPVSIPGCTVTLLTPAQAAAFAAVPTPNGGVTFDGTTFTALPVPPPAPGPAFALLPACGVGATGQVAAGSNDLLMAGTIHTGTSGTAAGDILQVTYGTPRTALPRGIQVFAQNVQLGTLIAKNSTLTGFTIATSAVPAINTTYSLLADVKS